MADPVVLQPNVPFDTPLPTLQVAGMQKPGVYAFRLVVTDDIGLVSAPVQVTVTVTTLLTPPTLGTLGTLGTLTPGRTPLG